MPTITKDKIIYNENDFLAGLHLQNGVKTIPQKFGKYSVFQQSFNPFINLGYAQNGYLNTNITNNSAITSRLVSKSSDDEDSDFFCLEDKGKLHSITNYNTAVNSGAFPHTITDAVRAFDICKYKIASSTYYFYTHRAAVPATMNIGRFDGASTFDDDYMSTVPTGKNNMFASALFNPLIVGHDDVLYVGGQNYVGSYDGPTDTFVQQTLALPAGYNIVGFAKYPSKSLVIFVQGNGECKAYFWDYLSLDPYDVKDIDDFDLLACFEYKNTVGCITKGKENSIKIKIFDGSIFKEVSSIDTSYNGRTLNGPHYKGVQVNNNEIWFNVSDSRNGYLCVYGNNLGLKNTLNVVAKNDVYVSESLSYSSGLLAIGRDGETIIDSGTLFTETDGSSAQYLDKTKCSVEGYWYSDLVDMGDERIRITGITIYFADEFTGGRTIALTLKDRYTTYDIQGITALGTVTSTNRIFRALPVNNTDGTPIPPLDGIGINLAWGTGAGSSVTPIINKIVLDYEPIKI